MPIHTYNYINDGMDIEKTHSYPKISKNKKLSNYNAIYDESKLTLQRYSVTSDFKVWSLIWCTESVKAIANTRAEKSPKNALA